MIAEKEALVELETLFTEQKRLFKDACDTGIWAEYEIRQKIRHLCKRLMSVYKSRSFKHKTCKGWTCFIPFETDEKLYVGVKVQITENGIKKPFFSINISQHQQTENPFREGE